MIRRPPRYTRTDTLLPYTTRCRSFVSIAGGFGHEALRSCRAQYPDVEVEIAEGEPRALLRQLRERELDIAFVTGQHDFVDLDSEVMWSESVVLAVARDHHVATRERLRWSRSEEHTSELQSLMRISYAVFCLKKKKQKSHSY